MWVPFIFQSVEKCLLMTSNFFFKEIWFSSLAKNENISFFISKGSKIHDLSVKPGEDSHRYALDIVIIIDINFILII